VAGTQALAFTGTSDTVVFFVGLVLVLCGGVLILAARRGQQPILDE
jgi:hypothetical protein